MKRKVTKVGLLRLSPNEEAQLLREEQDRRRKLRLQQVREQERHIALQIRKEVQHRRDQELQKLAEQLKADWEQQQRERLQGLMKVYEESLTAVGEGHRSAKENEPDWEAMVRKAEENNEKAAERHKEALKELKLQRQKQHEERTRHIQARRRAILAEKERAAKVASLPPRPPDPIEEIETKNSPSTKTSSSHGFPSKRYHLPETAVDHEAHIEQPDARVAAEEETRRLEQLARDEEREQREWAEKARLRGVHALRKEHLNQDRECLLQQLSRMQQADLLRRRQQVALMPPHIFPPLYKREEMREQRQRDLEIAFEDMYAGERKVKGDLALRLVPEPLTAMSTGSRDEDLDVTVEPTAEEPSDGTMETTAKGPADGSPKPSEETVEAAAHEGVEPSQPAPLSLWEREPEDERSRQALKKLLDRVRAQQMQRGSSSGSEISAAATESMSIESGSLSSQERAYLQPEPTSPAQDHETPEEPIITGAPELPREQSEERHRIEAERKKREEELECQKQEQITLLQQLEEQRRCLELHLQQVQLDKERLQAGLLQNSGKGIQRLSPAQEQEVPAASNVTQVHDAQDPPQDEHSRKIREYQHRLLEQSRRHQQSVVDARRQLQEYQRLLMTKYPSMAAEPGCPAAPSLRGVSVSSFPAEVCSGLLPPTSFAPVRKETTSLRKEATSGVPAAYVAHTLQAPPLLAAPQQRLRQGAQPVLPSQVIQEHSETRPVGMVTHPLMGILGNGSEVVPEISLGVFPGQGADTGTGSLHVTGPAVQFPSPHSADQELMWYTSEPAQDVPAPLVEEEQTPPEPAPQLAAFLGLQGAPEDTLHQQEHRGPMESVCTEAQHSGSSQTQRLSLMSALLSAMEESNLGEATPEGGSPVSSHGDSQGQDSSLSRHLLASDSFVLHKEQINRKGAHPRAPRPPMARPRLGILEMIEQHELSAIQEVETPDSSSFATAGEAESTAVSCTAMEEPEEWSSSNGSLGSEGRGWSTGGTGSGSSSRLTWRERLRVEASWCPERGSVAAPVLTDILRSQGVQRGSGLTKAGGSSGTEQERSSQGSTDRDSLPSGHHVDGEYLSSTTISTGSFSTEEPDLSIIGVELHNGGGFVESSPPGRGVADASPKFESLPFSRSVQGIINRYTKELNDSLSTPGSLKGNRDSGLGGPHSLTVWPGTPIQQDTPRSQPCVSGGSAADLRLDQTLGTPNRSQEWEMLSNSPAYLLNGHGGPLSCGSISRSSFEGLHNTSSHFLPLEPRPDVDSSSSSSSSRRTGRQERAMRAKWDRAMSRIVQLLSDQPSSPRPGEEADASVSLLITQLLSQSWQWMDAGGSPAGERQQSDTAGGSRVRSPAPQVVNQDFLHRKQDGSAGMLRTEAPPLTQVTGGNAQELLTKSVSELQNAGSFQPVPWSPPQDHPANEETLLPLCHSALSVDATSDSFHPLLAEMTANGTLESSMTLQGSQPLGPPEELSLAGWTLAEPEPLWASEASLEQLRAERSDFWQDTGAMLSDSSQVTVLDSVLVSSVVVEDPGLSSPLLEDSRPEPSHHEICSIRSLEAPDSQQQQKQVVLPVWERIMEAGSGRGILEEPDLTLLSLADSTAEQEEPSATQVEGSEALGGRCKSQKGEDHVSSEDNKSDECVSPGGTDGNSGDETVASRAAMMLLEFHATPGRLQDLFLQKRQDFVRRSAWRLEQVKARRREAASLQASQPGSSAQGQRAPPKDQLSSAELKKVGEVKVCAVEQRKMEENEMYQRTERLYNQLEEVRQRKEMRTRQESYARNREKAKEFQKKTLQKLRAKQTRR